MSNKDEFDEVDSLLMEYDGEKAYDLLIEAYKEDSKCEILWRLANALYIRYNCEQDHAKRAEYLKEGRKYALMAIEKEPENGTALKWAATLTGVLAEYTDTKERIQLGHEFKSYLDRALAIDPNREELLHMRGRFHYQVAGLGMLERAMAALFFASAPTASYEEALADFLKVDEMSPDELENTLYLAKCYEKMAQPERAIECLKKIVNSQAVDLIDSEHIEEARDLMEKLDPNFVFDQDEESYSDTDE